MMYSSASWRELIVCGALCLLIIGCWEVPETGGFELIREKTEQLPSGYVQTYRVEESASHNRDTIITKHGNKKVFEFQSLEDKEYIGSDGTLLDPAP